MSEHLIWIGLTVESKEYAKGIKLLSSDWGANNLIWGSVRVANRNIDLVELEQLPPYSFTGYYRCNFVVQAEMYGLEDRLKAKTRLVTIGEGDAVFMWEGKELAQMLNRDTNLKDTLYRMKKFPEIKPYRKRQCIRIREWHGYSKVSEAFPTIEAFEAYDRIAQHIRSIVARATV